MDQQSSAITTNLEAMVDLENELTNKFLSGQISFAEYSNEWYSQDDEEVSEDVHKRTDAATKSSSQVAEKVIKRRKFTRLSPALTGLMGEANLRFVRGEREMAEKMCYEIIKQVPTASEPYQTLAQMYEDEDADKSLQFYLLAAHLRPPDATEWLRLAAILKEKQDYRQEMICYTQALKADPQNLNLHLKRLELLTMLEGMEYSLHNYGITRVKCYHKLVSCLAASEGETIMKYCRLAVTMYHNNNEVEHATDVMSIAYKKCPSLFTFSDINIFMELLFSCKEYQRCIEVFVASAGVEIEAEIQTFRNSSGEIEEQTNYVNCSIPSNLPIDLKSKLLVCFTHLGAINLVHTLLNDFLSNDVEKAGDLYIDIEEALSSTGHHELAMQLLEPLVNNTSFDLAAVWLKHAECLFNLGREDDAINSYYKVLKHVPQHPDARRKLYAILEKRGKIDEALNILQQDYKYVVNAQLLYDYCVALKKYNKWLKYLEVGEALLSKTFVKFKHEEELNIACRVRVGKDLIHSFREKQGDTPFHEDDLHFDEEETFKLQPEEEWNLFKELLNIAKDNKLYYIMQRLSFGAMMSKNLHPHRSDIDFFTLQSSLLNNDYQKAFKFSKDIVQKYPTHCALNLLNLIIQSVEESVNAKFLLRLFQKDTDIVKNLFLGNNHLMTGRYLVSLRYYLEYHEHERDPLTALLISITILVMAAQRTVDKHHNLILQGISYLMSYKDLRKCDQEAYYNIGRAYHMLSINNLAIEYYERAMACGPITECSCHGSIDLTKEIAYNLYILYKDCSPQMSRKYMFKYLVV